MSLPCGSASKAAWRPRMSIAGASWFAFISVFCFFCAGIISIESGGGGT